MQMILPIVNRQMGFSSMLSYESMFPTLTQLLTNIIILCKFIICVYLLKDLLGQGGEHTLMLKKLALSCVSFQPELLNAFCAI